MIVWGGEVCAVETRGREELDVGEAKTSARGLDGLAAARAGRETSKPCIP
jgi:hypothetical protein